MDYRVIVIVLDSLGVGALPDASDYGDEGANTLLNIYDACNGIEMPNLVDMGIGHIKGLERIQGNRRPKGAYGKSLERSCGKDTTTGHWEMMGLHIDVPFHTFPEGFPPEFMEAFEKRIHRKTLGNIVASGTEIIKDLGEEHIKTGAPIIYTSADSVFQIAAHEEVIPLEELYEICKIAREMLTGELQVARVIARPFVGEPGNYVRTANRRDFSLSPFGRTVLDDIKEKGLAVYAIGKIEDIFNGQGITRALHTESNADGIEKTIEAIQEDGDGLIFTNLVDFDAKFGHRRNSEGYKGAIEEFDAKLPEIIAAMKANDLLILTADHGNDPTHTGTDHTREHIPILIYGDQVKADVNIGVRRTFADIGATISDLLKLERPENGESFKNLILK